MAIPQEILQAARASTTTRDVAREIMGKNFIDIDYAIQHLRMLVPGSVRALFEIVPWSKEMLESLKDTHVLVAVLPLSIVDVRVLLGGKLFCDCQDDTWYEGKPFADERGMPGWHLVRKGAVPNSTYRNWEEQQPLLEEDDMVPSARVLVHAAAGYYLRTGESLFQDTYLRCAEQDAEGDRVSVAVLHGTELHTEFWPDDYRSSSVELASERKPFLIFV